MAKSVRLGVVDWRRDDWAGRFYPADMPEDWRLSFYSSQYNCVFLSAPIWRAVDSADLAAWCDDVHSRFLFLLENDENSALPEALGERFILIDVTDDRIIWFDQNSDLKQLASAIQSAPEDRDLFLISRDANLSQMDRATTLLELLGW